MVGRGLLAWGAGIVAAALLAAPAAADCWRQCRSQTVCSPGNDCNRAVNNCVSECNAPRPSGPGWNLTPQEMREPPGGWGAFALSVDGQTIGKAKNWDREDGARRGAVESCRQGVGAAGCRTVFVFRNRCAALAMTPEGLWGAGAAQVPYVARELAMKRCVAIARQGCRIVSFQCSGRG
ncbi:MAG: DUF4189 domain-containing protein [Alphaproteobacteria bacterium]